MRVNIPLCTHERWWLDGLHEQESWERFSSCKYPSADKPPSGFAAAVSAHQSLWSASQFHPALLSRGSVQADGLFGSLDDYLQARAQEGAEGNCKRLFTNFMGKVRKILGGYGSGYYSSEEVAPLLNAIDKILHVQPTESTREVVVDCSDKESILAVQDPLFHKGKGRPKGATALKRMLSGGEVPAVKRKKAKAKEKRAKAKDLATSAKQTVNENSTTTNVTAKALLSGLQCKHCDKVCKSKSGLTRHEKSCSLDSYRNSLQGNT